MFDSKRPTFFAILYGHILLYYLRRAIRNPTQVFFFLSIFCAIRIATFVMYALLLHFEDFSPATGIMLDIFLCVGLSALLYSAYVLVRDREIASGNFVKISISRVASLESFASIILGLAVDIFILGTMFHSVLQGVYFILYHITILMGSHILFQAIAERTALSRPPPPSPLTIITQRLGMQPAIPSGKMNNTYITCLIMILLIISERITIDMANLPIRSAELRWSLWALTELLAVLLFAFPGLVPEKEAARSTFSLNFTSQGIVFAMTST